MGLYPVSLRLAVTSITISRIQCHVYKVDKNITICRMILIQHLCRAIKVGENKLCSSKGN